MIIAEINLKNLRAGARERVALLYRLACRAGNIIKYLPHGHFVRERGAAQGKQRRFAVRNALGTTPEKQAIHLTIA
jgi:hypothetical protein